MQQTNATGRAVQSDYLIVQIVQIRGGVRWCRFTIQSETSEETAALGCS